jgi:raffinose/stachyose/melibiose transport system permease protein
LKNNGNISIIQGQFYPQYFILPAFLLYAALFILPSLLGIGYSLTDWNIYRTAIDFIGLENFKEIFSTSSYRLIIGNTFLFALITTIFKMIFGLALALVLNENLRTRHVLRTIFYLPVVMSPLVIGLVFISIFNPTRGLLNQALRGIGLESLSRQWLADYTTAMPVVMSVEIWRMSGYCMVIFLAGLQLIPQNLYEVASIDGAGGWQKFVNITLPFLRPSITMNLILNIIWGLKAFDIIFILTKGGPGHMSEVINVSVFDEFSSGRYGFATALGVVIFFFTSVIAFIVLRVLSKREVDFV